MTKFMGLSPTNYSADDNLQHIHHHHNNNTGKHTVIIFVLKISSCTIRTYARRDLFYF